MSKSQKFRKLSNDPCTARSKVSSSVWGIETLGSGAQAKVEPFHRGGYSIPHVSKFQKKGGGMTLEAKEIMSAIRKDLEEIILRDFGEKKPDREMAGKYQIFAKWS